MHPTRSQHPLLPLLPMNLLHDRAVIIEFIPCVAVETMALSYVRGSSLSSFIIRIYTFRLGVWEGQRG